MSRDLRNTLDEELGINEIRNEFRVGIFAKFGAFMLATAASHCVIVHQAAWVLLVLQVLLYFVHVQPLRHIPAS